MSYNRDCTTKTMKNKRKQKDGWYYDGKFYVTKTGKIAWTSGILFGIEPGKYTIDAGRVRNEVAKTYVYFNPYRLGTTFRTTIKASKAVGLHKMLVAVAEKDRCVVFGGNVAQATLSDTNI